MSSATRVNAAWSPALRQDSSRTSRPSWIGSGKARMAAASTATEPVGRYALFRAALAGFRTVPVLMAHGNHDSYLMGTVNSYVPGRDVGGWRPEAMASADLPVDESWWGAPREPASHQPSIAVAGDVHVAWTDVVGGEPRLQGVVLRDPDGIE